VTKPAKLYQRLLEGHRAIRFSEFRRVIEAFGLELKRVKGSHHVYGCAGLDRPLIVQPNGKDAKGYQIEQFLAMVAKHSLMLED
jgi:predicted RNA binding protein YcfA (HicA-like mRNA interferase family)